MSICSESDNRELNVMQAEQCQQVEFTQTQNDNPMMVVPEGSGIKRPRDDDGDLEENENESDWTTVTRSKEKKYKPTSLTEIYITCNEILPKQFAFAKLLKCHGITEVMKVKYINAYKIRLDFNCEVMAKKIATCEELIGKGWKFHRAMEPSYSYGVLKNVDLDLSEDEIFDSITCPNPAKLVSVHRMQRRSDSKWIPSEAVRLCFKGTFLPGFVFADGLKIKVDSYIFPVSQCWRCWQLGHLARKCPKNKIVCPKCSGNHENCDTQNPKCVNCSGSHISMSRICPRFKKEKRLREIMAEFNCTYRKAMDVYVEPEKQTQDSEEPTFVRDEPPPSSDDIDDSIPLGQRTYAETLRKKPQSGSTARTDPQTSTKKQSKKGGGGQADDAWEDSFNFEYAVPPTFERDSPGTSSQERPIKFSELLVRIKEILFLQEVSFKNKLLNILRCCIRWGILVVASKCADSPYLKFFLNFFNAD